MKETGQSAQIFNLASHRKALETVPELQIPPNPFVQLYNAFTAVAKQIRQTPFFLELLPAGRLDYPSFRLEAIAGKKFLDRDFPEGTTVLAGFTVRVEDENGLPRLQKTCLSITVSKKGRRVSFFHGVMGGDGMRLEALRREPSFYEFDKLYEIKGGKTTRIPLRAEAAQNMFGSMEELLYRQKQQAQYRKIYQPLAT